MIKVDIKCNKYGVPFYFNTTGHASYADPGKDIICSAVSVLMMVIANSMELNTPDNIKVSQNEKTATITIELPTIKDGNGSKELIVLSKTLHLGLTQIEQEYGNKYICVKEDLQC